MSYEISAFRPEVQKIIQENGNYFDRNQSGTIEKEEMPLLIFCTNAENESELLIDNRSFWDKKKDDYLKGSAFTALSGIATWAGTKILPKSGRINNIAGALLATGSILLGGLGLYHFARQEKEKTIKLERLGVSPELLSKEKK